VFQAPQISPLFKEFFRINHPFLLENKEIWNLKYIPLFYKMRKYRINGPGSRILLVGYGMAIFQVEMQTTSQLDFLNQHSQ